MTHYNLSNLLLLLTCNGEVGNFVMVKRISDLCCFISLTTMPPLQCVSIKWHGNWKCGDKLTGIEIEILEMGIKSAGV